MPKGQNCSDGCIKPHLVCAIFQIVAAVNQTSINLEIANFNEPLLAFLEMVFIENIHCINNVVYDCHFRIFLLHLEKTLLLFGSLSVLQSERSMVKQHMGNVVKQRERLAHGLFLLQMDFSCQNIPCYLQE